MAEAGKSVGESATRIIPIHFDVPAHQIPLSTFIRTARQTEAVIQSFNRELFEGRLKYAIFILPPEEGTFLSRLKLVILAGSIWTFIESNIGTAFIKGLTDHEPAYWAEKAGTVIKEHFGGSAKGADVEDEGNDQAARCWYEATIVAEAAKSFMQKDIAELESIGVTPRRFRDAYEARNEFYQACAETPDLRAIGFEERPVFPVPRSEFSRLQIALPPEDDEEKKEPWLMDIVMLKVTSPNWDRADRQRQWKAKDGHGRERFFRVEDEYFWSLVEAGTLSTHIIDTIKAQWVFRGKTESPKTCRVLKVLEFNGQILSDQLDDDALKNILGLYGHASSDQIDLFEA